MYDIAIIGAGPAGLSAAVTAGVRNKTTVLFEANDFSPKLKKALTIKNYLGMPNVAGEELMEKFLEHAKSFKPDIIKQKVVGLAEMENYFTIATAGEVYQAKSIILTVGISHSEALPGEKAFLGKGVSYCATCDGYFYKNKKVAVVSYVPTALEEVEFLAELCEEVYYLPQYDIKDMPKHENITIVSDKPTEITGTENVTGLATSGEYLGVQGVFVFRDSDPIENLLPNLQLRGKSILVDEKMATNIDGIFAAGDCTGQPWQISRATGQGLIAALSAVSYLAQE